MQLTLTNETGSTSPGMIMGVNQNTINAMMWNGAIGTLSAHGKTINWSNARSGLDVAEEEDITANNDSQGPAGAWFVNGDQSRSCQITQNGKKLQLQNEQGSTASGSIPGKKVTTSGWPGNPVGTLTIKRNRIDWSNGTSWTR